MHFARKTLNMINYEICLPCIKNSYHIKMHILKLYSNAYTEIKNARNMHFLKLVNMPSFITYQTDNFSPFCFPQDNLRHIK